MRLRRPGRRGPRRLPATPAGRRALVADQNPSVAVLLAATRVPTVRGVAAAITQQTKVNLAVQGDWGSQQVVVPCRRRGRRGS